jgi:hypothetical protein
VKKSAWEEKPGNFPPAGSDFLPWAINRAKFRGPENIEADKFRENVLTAAGKFGLQGLMIESWNYARNPEFRQAQNTLP